MPPAACSQLQQHHLFHSTSASREIDALIQARHAKRQVNGSDEDPTPPVDAGGMAAFNDWR